MSRQKIYVKSSYRSKLFFMFMMFMWVSSTTPLTSFNFGKNPVLMPIYLLILGYYFFKHCRLSKRPMWLFFAMIFIWFTLHCILKGTVLKLYFIPVYSMLIACIAFNLYQKDEFLSIFEKILVWLCTISLVVWSLTNIIPGVMVSFMHAIAVYENHPPTEAHCFITGIGTSFELGLRRNIGFTWEPGKFSCWCVIGLWVNMIRNHFVINFRHNRNFWILAATLFSTLSTTGWSIASLLVLFYVWNIKGMSKLFVILLAVMVFSTIIGVSFMGDKIAVLMDIDGEIQAVNYYGSQGHTEVCPQRFGGLYFEWISFIHDFWIGYYDNVYSYATTSLFKGITVVVPSNGLLRPFARYGIFIGLFFYYFLFKSSCFLAKAYNYKGKFFFAAIFMTMSISYDFWENCLMMYFYLSTFFMHYSDKYFIGTNIQSNRYGNICNYNLL